jgi:hypothetical protein
MKIFVSVVVTVVFLLSVSINAGVIIKMAETSEKIESSMQSTLYIEKDRLRMEAKGEDQNHIVIFRGDKNVFWSINPDEKSYFEMTQADIQKMKGQMEKARQQMMEQMKNMPAEQRKMMEEMMPSNMRTTETVKTTYTKKSSGIKVGKWSCTHFEGFKNGVKSDEIWVADWGQIGLTKSDLGVLQKMGAFFKALSQETDEFFEFGTDEWEKQIGMSGAPMRSINYFKGQKSSQTEVKDVIKQNLNAALFDLPAGYSKEESPMDKMGEGMNPY